MEKIKCDICMDLIPLVQDGVASRESSEAVKEHIKTCDSCRMLLEGKEVCKADKNSIIGSFRRKVWAFSLMLLLVGLFFGVGISFENEFIYYNVIIIPILGVIGFYLFKYKAFF